MGKASKWLRGLFGLKKPDSSSSAATGAKPTKKKWGFVKSYKEKDQHPTNIPAIISDDEVEDPSKHAIKLAAATAVVAEAAVAAAQAAAEVVRLTSSGRAISGNSNSTPCPSANNRVTRFGNARVCSLSPASVNGGEYLREDTAAVIIQSYFRGYLSRRALRALRALVRLQAIVRGRIWRKKYSNELHHWKELLRTHTLVNAGRVAIFESPHKGPATPEQFERMKNGESLMYKRNGSQNRSRINQTARNASRSDECTKPKSLFHSSHLSIGNSDQYSQSFEVHSSTSPFKFSYYVEDDPFWSAESSLKRTPLTPTRSDGSRSCLSGYSDAPNYMTCTESSKAKIRSLSAPRQRPAAAQQYERSSSTTARRLSIIHGCGQRIYPGSGRLDRMGMPVMAIREGVGVGFSGGLWHRF